ncbi:MAG: hypothetical protein ACJATV_001709 [Granulosicoccus sp.]|jgi:hypothetical protein
MRQYSVIYTIGEGQYTWSVYTSGVDYLKLRITFVNGIIKWANLNLFFLFQQWLAWLAVTLHYQV